MSRFHDEFFRQGSPAHDALMIKCLSKTGIKQICDAVDTESAAIKTCGWSKRVIVCKVNGGRVARLGDQDYGFDSLNEWAPTSCPKRYGCEYSSTEECMFINSKNNPDFSPTHANIPAKLSITNVETKKETEALVRNGTFIIGYADALIDLIYEGTVSYPIDDGFSVAGNDVEIPVRILVEAKPKLVSIGEVVRQLKTYKSIVKTARIGKHQSDIVEVFSVIATYTNLSEDAIDYLKNENITVVVFEEEA